MSGAPHVTPLATRHNNFDAVRLFAAFLVLWGHQFALMGKRVPLILGNEPGALGVVMFFTLSGYLVTLSWMADPHAGRFTLRRALRIWPGLMAAVVFCTAVVGPLFTTLSLQEYALSYGTWQYFTNLWLDTRYWLPGVFQSHPYPLTVNGTLWTIRLEVGCYVALGLAGVLGLLRWRVTGLLALVVLATALQWRYAERAGIRLPPWSAGLQYGLMFGLGVALASMNNLMLRRRTAAMALLLTATTALYWLGPSPLYGQASLLALGGSAVILGSCATTGLVNAGRYGDFSYGLYIYGFPVQQAVVALGGTEWGFLPALLLGLVITLVLAALSWHVIEKPALSLKPSARRAALYPGPHVPHPAGDAS